MSSGLQFRVGAQTNADGATPQARLTKGGNVATDQAHGRYYEENYRGNVFFASLQASTTFTLFGTTTATGLILSNPTGSGKNLVLLQVSYALVVAATTAISQIVLSGAASSTAVTHTTAVTIYSGQVGVASSGVGKADSAATIPTAGLVIMPLFTPSVSATATTSIPPASPIDLGGSVIVPPGAFVAMAAGYTNTITGVATMVWTELPV